MSDSQHSRQTVQPEQAAVYHLLSRLWDREVDADLLRALQSGELGTAYVEAGGIIPKGEDEQSLLEDLAIDYCQLFLGPTGHLPPYQSVWEEDQFNGRIVLSLKQYLGTIGYPMQETDRQTLDALSVELSAMGYLLEQMSDWEGPYERDQADLLDLAGRFFHAHLAWSEPLLQRAQVRARTDFYRGMVRLTANFLAAERHFWRAAVESVQRAL